MKILELSLCNQNRSRNWPKAKQQQKKSVQIFYGKKYIVQSRKGGGVLIAKKEVTMTSPWKQN